MTTLFLITSYQQIIGPEEKKINTFNSEKEIIDAFKDANKAGILDIARNFGSPTMALSESADSLAKGEDYSTTNVQVQGVDEADIIKTDGKYIYTISQGSLVIVNAYPAENSEILSTTKFNNFNPLEIFIYDDRLLIFGTSNIQTGIEEENQLNYDTGGARILNDERIAILPPYPIYKTFTTVKLFDISEREEPEELRSVDFEGYYLTSRMIGSDVYFVINTYTYYSNGDEIIPLYREGSAEAKPIANANDIGYIEPIQAQNFLTIASISMDDENREIIKETIVGAGQNVYASENNLYIAQVTYPRSFITDIGDVATKTYEKTIISKFNFDNGKFIYRGTGEVPGHILNQFSMDEYDNHFRIATTKGQVWAGQPTNNVYILDNELNLVGSLEDLAPGESIYSVRFMDKRGYVVTFKKVDPLFVIDLSNPENPEVLGKLKIPGYSNYLHPYDETHLIGIGKDTIEGETITTIDNRDNFVWYQGIKMAIFDVSNVNNPIEMHKVVIGDRGTESPVLYNHKAFLFDKERGLLVLPITLAEIKNKQALAPNEFPGYGEYTFQGAYVYNVNLNDGFTLRGRVTQYDNANNFIKSGFYFSGQYSIERSLFIKDVLYTLSSSRLMLSDLDTLETIKKLNFESENGYQGAGYSKPSSIPLIEPKVVSAVRSEATE